MKIDFEGTRLDHFAHKAKNPNAPDMEWAKAHGLIERSKEEAMERFNQKAAEPTRRGRKLMHYKKRSKPRGIALRDSEYHELKVWGEGSASTGIRLLLTMARRQIIDAPKPVKRKHKLLPPQSHLTKIDPKTGKRYNELDSNGD